MNEQTVQATPLMWGLISISFLLFVGGFVVLFSGRKRTGRFSWAGFVFIMFGAVLFYDLGLCQLTGKIELLFVSCFHALQTMTADREFELPTILGASEAQLSFLGTYGALLFIIAPVSIVTAALDYFSGVISSLILRGRSFLAESFVFSRLDERTLDLAQDICDTYRKRGKVGLIRPCIAFANCGNDDVELRAAAHKLRAYCLSDNVSDVSNRCSGRTNRWIVLVEDDEVAAIATARQLKEAAQSRQVLFGGGETRIFVLTDFRDTEPLLFPEVLQEEKDADESGADNKAKVLVRGIDLSRELIEQTIIRYPVFLLSKPLPGVNVPLAGSSVNEARGVPSTCWYQVDEQDIMMSRRRELYERPDRHILVLGAGSMGTEFLSYALWASRMDGMHTKIEVIDNAQDHTRPGKSLAEARYAAEAPEVMRRRAGAGQHTADGEELYDLGFSLIDAETDAYARFLAERAKTVTYVFVALGDDLRNARVAMRTRQILERELAKNTKSRDEFVRASRPLIVTVIRNDDFATTVEKAMYEGQPYDIVCVGNDSDILTYKMLEMLVGTRDTEYKRRSSRTSNDHIKYRFFAFARSLLLNRHDVRSVFTAKPNDETLRVLRDTLGVSPHDEAYKELCALFDEPLTDDKVLDILGQVDWTVDVKGTAEEASRVNGWTLALMYQLYCTNGVTHALNTGEGTDTRSREWLLRMEHDRWNAYIRTQGIEVAQMATVARIFATGQTDKEKHRSVFAGLHPFLVSFDELAALETPVYDLYLPYHEALVERGQAKDRNTNVSGDSWARLLDDNYIGIKRPKYGKKA